MFEGFHCQVIDLFHRCNPGPESYYEPGPKMRIWTIWKWTKTDFWSMFEVRLRTRMEATKQIYHLIRKSIKSGSQCVIITYVRCDVGAVCCGRWFCWYVATTATKRNSIIPCQWLKSAALVLVKDVGEKHVCWKAFTNIQLLDSGDFGEKNVGEIV